MLENQHQIPNEVYGVHSGQCQYVSNLSPIQRSPKVSPVLVYSLWMVNQLSFTACLRSSLESHALFIYTVAFRKRLLVSPNGDTSFSSIYFGLHSQPQVHVPQWPSLPLTASFDCTLYSSN